MTKRIPQPRCELEPGVRAHEAKLLATMLRTSRLTWIFAEPGTDKSALLRNGVLPLLQRRSGDRGRFGEAAAARFGLAAPAERRRARGRARRELAVYFDAWDDAPLSQLKRRVLAIAPGGPSGCELQATLAELLRQTQRQGLDLVFLLDRFEAYLAQGAGQAEPFAGELVEAITQQAPCASFLVAVDEAARPALERFRSSLPGFDDNALRLSPITELRAPAVAAHFAASRSAAALEPLAARRQPQRQPVKVEDVYALIEATLSSQRSAQPPAQALDAFDPPLLPSAAGALADPDVPARSGQGRS